MADKFRSIPDVARYAHQRPDGTILYFESDGKRSHEGELPPGTDPTDLEAQGFVFLAGDAYARTQRSLDPIARAEEADADELAEAFDMSMGTTGGDTDILQNLLDQKMAEQANQPQAGAQQGGQLSPEMLSVLQQYMQEGRLNELFQPFQQEQSVLNQQMQIAQGVGQQRSPQRSSPTGALFGGLSNAVSNVGSAVLQKKALEGQSALGKRMQGEASGRVGAILREMQRRQGIDPSTGLRGAAVDDAALANIFAGGAV